jgi:protein-tyrosine sulfotransferase
MKLNIAHIKKRARKRLRNRQEQQLHDAGWYDVSARSEMDAVFIGGCGRSGTTLFKELLNRHSRCACGPETSLFGLPFNIENIAAPWDIDTAHLKEMRSASSNLIEFADRFACEFLSEEGKSRWVEKTPNNVRAIDRLLTWYPQGRFIHVVRDGRDVVCSLRNHPRERIVDGKIVPMKIDNPVELSAERWLKDTMMGLAFKDHPRCLEVRYEALVTDPEAELKRVCAFIGENYESAMMAQTTHAEQRSGQNLNNERASRSISAKSVERWKTDLTSSERQSFIDVAGELLITLGYVSDHSWADTKGGRDE